MHWPVVPLSTFQRLDIRSDDLLFGGDFRKCNIIKTKLTMDKTYEVTFKRFGKYYHNQFVVQLFGCPLHCWYCYVTPDGINSKPHWYSTEELLSLFLKSGCDTFHLMGGAPALYYENWYEIAEQIPNNFLFLSDFLLVETTYHTVDLKRLSSIKNAIFALSIKGTSAINFKTNTGVDLKEFLFYENLKRIIDSGLNYYVVFTNPNHAELPFMIDHLHKFGVDMDDWFSIEPIQYQATQAYQNSNKENHHVVERSVECLEPDC